MRKLRLLALHAWGADRRWRRIGDVLEKQWRRFGYVLERRWRIVKVIANVLKGSDSNVSKTLVPEGSVICELRCGSSDMSSVKAK